MNPYDPTRHNFLAMIMGLALIPFSVYSFLSDYGVTEILCSRSKGCLLKFQQPKGSYEIHIKPSDIETIQVKSAGKGLNRVEIQLKFQNIVHQAVLSKQSFQALDELIEQYKKTGDLSIKDNRTDWYYFLWALPLLFGFALIAEFFKKRPIKPEE